MIFPLDLQASQTIARLLRWSLQFLGTQATLAQWAAANETALARLTESDRQSVRDAYRAKRDELTGAAA